jgi:hypothetical protein
MSTPYTGGCRCGNIRYSCDGKSSFVYYCHCNECQKTTGTAFHTGISVPLDSVTMLQNEPTKHNRTADSGNTLTEAFCNICGCPIYVQTSGRSDFVSLKAGSLDDSSWVNPDIQIWTKSRVSWCDPSSAKTEFEEGRK